MGGHVFRRPPSALRGFGGSAGPSAPAAKPSPLPPPAPRNRTDTGPIRTSQCSHPSPHARTSRRALHREACAVRRRRRQRLGAPRRARSAAARSAAAAGPPGSASCHGRWGPAGGGGRVRSDACSSAAEPNPRRPRPCRRAGRTVPVAAPVWQTRMLTARRSTAIRLVRTAGPRIRGSGHWWLGSAGTAGWARWAATVHRPDVTVADRPGTPCQAVARASELFVRDALLCPVHSNKIHVQTHTMISCTSTYSYVPICK